MAMKSMMFNENYGLESATTIYRRKKRTSRNEFKKKLSPDEQMFVDELNTKTHIAPYYSIEKGRFEMRTIKGWHLITFKPKYKVGEIIAVKQSYEDAYTGWIHLMINKCINFNREKMEIVRNEKGAGLGNKMFVRNDLMPYHIKITEIKLQRLQNISDEDCLIEGIIQHPNGMFGTLMNLFKFGLDYKRYWCFKTPREAFASLIDKVSCKGTWERNEYHVVYYYELTTL